MYILEWDRNKKKLEQNSIRGLIYLNVAAVQKHVDPRSRRTAQWRVGRTTSKVGRLSGGRSSEGFAGES